MPRYGQPTSGGTTPPAGTGQGRYAVRASTPTPEAPEDSSINPWAIGAAGVAAGGAALLARNPAIGKKAFDAFLAARYIPMLSGFALPKSVLGNVGAAVVSSAERRSLKPLSEFFSTATAKEFGRELMNPTARGTNQVAQQAGRYNPIGRVMGAADQATQGALQRAGLTAAQSAEQTLQTPIPQAWAKPLATPLGRYVVPFQRTPFNQFIQTFKASAEHPGIAGASAAAGAVTGASTEDVLTPGIVAPLTGRYSGPFLVGAIAGRALSGGQDAERVGFGLSPTSDSAIADPVLNPGRSFLRPSVLSMLKYFGLVEE
jgi:hypothetical protein